MKLIELTLSDWAFYMFRFGGRYPPPPPPVCRPIPTEICTGIDNQNISSNVKKLHKNNDVIDSDGIILRHLVKKGLF